MQAGKVNSIAALHDARSKQVLNPLKMRKAPQGAAANPVIRQRSVAQQAHHKQHFADTLRRNSDWEAIPAADEQTMRDTQSAGTPDSQQQLQQQPDDGPAQAAAFYRGQLEAHANPLASSKSEPHGMPKILACFHIVPRSVCSPAHNQLYDTSRQ